MNLRFYPLATALVLLSPAVLGAQPAWAWGFLWAFVCLAAVLRILPSFRKGPGLATAQAGFPGIVGWPACLVLAWLCLTVLMDRVLGTASGRYPALSWQPFAFALAFAATACLGAEAGVRLRRLRLAMRMAFLAGVAYAALVLLQFLNLAPDVLGVREAVHDHRPSGTYLNSNRFAVLLGMLFVLGNGLLLIQIARPDRNVGERRRQLWLAVSVLGLATILPAIAFTLSRLTVAAVILGIAIAWSPLIVSASAFSWGRSKLRPTAFLLALVTLLAVIFSFGGQALGTRFRDNLETGASARWQACQAAIPLLNDNPWLGTGLGSFPTVFTPHHPMAFNEHWNHVHSDFLEIAIETGLPGLGFVLLLLAGWWMAWGRRYRAAKDVERIYLAAGAGALAVPLICSIADYPLREPANAAVFFFFAGAIAQRTIHRPPRSKTSTAVLAACLIPLFLFAAYASLRAGLGGVASPQFGAANPPEPRAEDAAAYARALRFAPLDPLLLKKHAQCRLQAAQTTWGPDRAEALKALEQSVEALVQAIPNDYTTLWLQAGLSAQKGELAEATELLTRASDRFPSYKHLLHLSIMARLEFVLGEHAPNSPEWEREAGRIVQRAALLVSAAPSFEQQIVKALEGHRIPNGSICRLWDGHAEATWPKARYLVSRKDWAKAGKILGAATAGERGHDWYLALHGRVLLAQGALAEGAASWARIGGLPGAQDPGVPPWLKTELAGLDASALEELSKHGAFAGNEELALHTGRLLFARCDPVIAEVYVQKVLQRHPGSAESWKLAAEVAARMGDRAAARSRAQEAYRLSDRSKAWSVWHSQFELNVEGK